jgi:hypothetical protein
MVNDRYSGLNPGAVVAALRSFPRRYRAALSSDPTRAPDELGTQRSRAGRPVLELLTNTVGTLGQLCHALHKVLVADHPPALPAIVTGNSAHVATTRAPTVSALLEELDEVAQRSAEMVSSAPSESLLRVGHAPEGTEVTALDIGRQSVRVAAENLRAVEQALRDAGIDPGADADPDADSDD